MVSPDKKRSIVRINPVVFNTFKWTTYALLCVNEFFFWREDAAAAAHIYADGVPFGELINAYAATIDDGAWLVLMFVFELETSAIPHHKLTRRLKWSLTAASSICYALILYSFYGYFQQLLLSYDFIPTAIEDACTLITAGYSVVIDLGEFIPLSAENCLTFAGQEVFRLGDRDLIANAESIDLARRLAWTDVANAAAWLGVVAILEADLWMKLRGDLSPGFDKFSKISKVILYGTLFAAAIQWQIDGGFVDTWDAYLWLIAFVFIEMNFFDWDEEEESAT
ncbi:MAG: hypothetical protein JRE57_03010 [Deltaproteobacteria bacterium]|nr:hypothetical protein [Deltaproteobacteria bacterium]